ncbi:Glucose 1-dehydrogenase 2 [Polystyrenella longa]|uniref:Glucose 1-dehydrogenase 2 n=1 Tax=Polystyrenella longa TaxID=2528007 RepID=A0A518CQ69_9PLAN|nr:SDR family oxidoreductase [Polystyrenella longa]QDU81382.1 Glucose 1-dehydrogenase 2 [Polystyrenella longa]
MTTPEPTIHELFSLKEKVAFISGATGYLGSAMARALAEAGANVVVSSRSQERGDEFAATLPVEGNQQHYAVVMDQKDEVSIKSAFASACELAGKVDVLFNNGTQGDGHDWNDVSYEQFVTQVENSAGYFVLGREFRNHIVERKTTGSLILIGSMYGVVASYPDAYEGVCNASPVGYHALKGGIIHMTRHLAAYWAQDGVRVNCLSPGPFPNFDIAPAEMIKRLETKNPMKRMGHPHELKGAAILLASEAGSYITGQNLLVDGGWTAW